MHETVSLERSLGRIEGKLDMLIDRFDSKITDHEDRITGTERKVWYASGIAAAITLFLGKLSFFPH